MAAQISIKKGGMSIVTVLVSYGVAVAAGALAKAVGVDIPADSQTQITVAITAGLTGLITGGLNWLKHKKDAKPVTLPKV
jgi:hypothetical protein